MNDEIKLLLKKIKTEKRKKFENDKKSKQLEILLVKIKNADKPDKLGSALNELIEIQVFDKNLHGIKQEILTDYVGEFKMVGNLKVGIKSDKLILDLEILPIMNLRLMLSIKVMIQKMLFSVLLFIN